MRLDGRAGPYSHASQPGGAVLIDDRISGQVTVPIRSSATSRFITDRVRAFKSSPEIAPFFP